MQYPIITEPIKHETIIGYRADYTGIVEYRFLQGTDTVLTCASIMDPDFITSSLNGYGYVLLSEIRETTLVPGARVDVREKKSQQLVFSYRYLGIEWREIVIGGQVISVRCHPGKYVFAKERLQVARMKKANVFYHILPTTRPETEPYFECEFSWQLSGLEKTAILAFPILCYWL